MKTTPPRYAWLVLLFTLLIGQNINAQCEKSDFDCWISKSIEMVKSGNYKKAKEMRAKAKGARNSDQQKEVYEVYRKRLKHDYKDYWEKVETGNALLKLNKFDDAMKDFENSKSKIQECILEQFTTTNELDGYLDANIDEIIKKTIKLREETISRLINTADEYVQKEYFQKALDNYKEAMQYEEDAMARSEIEDKYMEVKYDMHMRQGRDDLMAEKAYSALTEFREAKKIKNNGEVDRKIIEAEDMFFEQKIEKAISLGENMQFEKAKKELDQAATIRKDSEFIAAEGAIYLNARWHYIEEAGKAAEASDFKKVRVSVNNYNKFKSGDENKGNELINQQTTFLTSQAESKLENDQIDLAIQNYQHLLDLTGDKKYENRKIISKRIKKLVDLENSNLSPASIADLPYDWNDLESEAKAFGIQNEEYDFKSKKSKAEDASSIYFEIEANKSNQNKTDFCSSKAQDFPYKNSDYINKFIKTPRVYGKVRIKINLESQTFGPIHNGDCTRMKGTVSYILEQDGVEIEGDNVNYQTIVNYQENKSKDFKPGDFGHFNTNNIVTFTVSEEALEQGRIKLKTNFALQGCHKSGDFQGGYNCKYHYNKDLLGPTVLKSMTKSISAKSSSQGHTFTIIYNIEQHKI